MKAASPSAKSGVVMNDPRIDWANAVARSSGSSSTSRMNHLPNAERVRPEPGEIVGDRTRLVEQRFVRHDAVHETETAGLVGGDPPPA